MAGISEIANGDSIRQQVRAGYAEIAKTGTFSFLPGGCCGSSPCDAERLVESLGYSAAETSELPAGANMGLSCGNPTALAGLKPGETVLDLGSGGGFDVFLAGPRVGPTGRVIGVDMTADMVSAARRNCAGYRDRTGLDNVEFRLGEIEHLPLACASVDCIISNCVINLSPDKPQVWREMFRVLKPGGRVAISDLHLLQPLPEVVRNEVAALIGCIAGASLVPETRAMAKAAGFVAIELTQKSDYVEAMIHADDALYRRLSMLLPAGASVPDYVTSLDIAAQKPL